VYESSYVFSPKNYINHQERENNNLQELIEMMYNLEKEGKQLVSYVRELKARDT
jgi:ferritin